MSATSKTMRVLAGAEVVASWASQAHGVSTVGELMAQGQQPDEMPEDVAAAWQALLQLPLADLTRITRKIRVASLAETLLSEMPQSRRVVFKERCLALDPPSLEALGYQMRVTRERVRQLENAAEESVDKALEEPRFKVLRWRAQALACSLGSAIPTDHTVLSEALHEVGGTGDLEDVADKLLLWLAGPYKEKHGWLVRFGTVIPQECSRLIEFADRNGVIGSMERANSLLSEMGLRSEVHEEWLRDCRYVRLFRNHAIVARGSVADKSVPILSILGESQTPGRLAELVEEGHSPMTVRNAIYRDSRFIRSSKNEFGLSSWGLEPYLTSRRGRNGSAVLV